MGNNASSAPKAVYMKTDKEELRGMSKEEQQQYKEFVNFNNQLEKNISTLQHESEKLWKSMNPLTRQLYTEVYEKNNPNVALHD